MIVSIDIGTSYSSICIPGDSGKAVPVDISTGTSMYGSKFSLPSAVFVEDDGSILVGQAAMNSRKRAPQNFRMEFKRDMGQDIPILLGQRQFLPKDLYAEMFRHMVDCATKTGGGAIEKAYITYPASFGKKKREQITEAARAAGLFETVLVDEPTAAAMGYFKAGLIKEGEKILIYDFGGGTFDASLLGCNRGEFHSLAEPAGLEHCGGIDIDRMIYEDMLRKLDPDMLALVNQKPINRMRLDSQLAELAVKAKHHLSSAKNFSEDIQIGFELVPYSLSREALEGMISPIVGQTISVCRSLLKNAGLEASDLSAILMVGGTSRIPLVQTAVAQLAKNVPVLASMDLELAVASGALGFETKTDGMKTAATDIKAHGVPAQEEPAADTSKKHEKMGVTTAVKEPPKLDSGRKEEPEKITPQLYAPDINRCFALLKGSGTVLLSDKFYMDVNHQRQIKEWKDIIQLCGQNISKEKFLMGLRKDGTIIAEIVEDCGMCDISAWHDIVRIACGHDHIVGLKKDGTVLAVGSNRDGQCNVYGWKNIVYIACGYSQTYGITKDGTVLAVGNNNDKQCDCAVSQWWKDIIMVSGGFLHTAGLKKDGTAVAVGNNSYGQCNIDSYHGWKNLISITCGEYYTVGLRSDGTVIAVGDNEYGQCNIHEWKDIIAVFANAMHTFGLRKDGAILMTDFDLEKRSERHWLKADETKYHVVNKRTELLKEKWF